MVGGHAVAVALGVVVDDLVIDLVLAAGEGYGVAGVVYPGAGERPFLVELIDAYY